MYDKMLIKACLNATGYVLCALFMTEIISMQTLNTGDIFVRVCPHSLPLAAQYACARMCLCLKVINSFASGTSNQLSIKMIGALRSMKEATSWGHFFPSLKVKRKGLKNFFTPSMNAKQGAIKPTLF